MKLEIDQGKDYELPRVEVRLVGYGALASEQAIRTPEDAIRLIGEDMRSLDREYVCIINVATNGKPINFSYVGIGTLDSCMLHPREIFKSAILSSASSVIMVHNHPGGNIQPSGADLNATKVIAQSGKVLGIPLRDHIIVPSGCDEQNYFSFNERGLINQYIDEYSVRDHIDPWAAVGQNATSYGMSEKIKEITKQLEDGLRDLQDSDKYKAYLKTMSKFHIYSPANCLLIMYQCPEASHVAGYQSWIKNFNHHVNKGEKAIRILAPCPYKIEHEKEVIDTDGTVHKEKELVTITRFTTASVFDISQTTGPELPKICSPLQTDSLEDFEKIKAVLVSVSPVPITFESISNGANGFYDTLEKKIVIKEKMSNDQTVKTMIHEISHSILHDKDSGIHKDEKLARNDMEVEAESIAFVVANHYGIDTSDYSFGYITGWSSSMELKEFKQHLETIQKTSGDLINKIDAVLAPNEVQERTECISKSKSISMHM